MFNSIETLITPDYPMLIDFCSLNLDYESIGIGLSIASERLKMSETLILFTNNFTICLCLFVCIIFLYYIKKGRKGDYYIVELLYVIKRGRRGLLIRGILLQHDIEF